MSFDWSDLSFTIDGARIEGMTDLSFTIDGARIEGMTEARYSREPAFASDPYRSSLSRSSISAECTVTLSSREDFANFFPHEPPGASTSTLVRRVRYGGRKGRSALRRLFDRALPIVMSSGFTRCRGRAVILDETEMRIRVHSISPISSTDTGRQR